MDPVHAKLAIRIANDAVTMASLEAQNEALSAQNAALSAEITRLQGGVPTEAPAEIDPSPEGDED